MSAMLITNGRVIDPANGADAVQDVLIMHPGPVNRGIELSPEVADGPYSVILDQVAKGVAVRMGVLFLLAGSKAEGAS